MRARGFDSDGGLDSAAMASSEQVGLGSLLDTARKKPAPAYLFVGDPFQTVSAARRLIDVLVPAERRGLNLESYDGRTASIAPILDSLRTPALFRGTKVVWLREPTLFLSGEKRGDVTEALLEAWGEERRDEAAEKLLVLASLAGWTQEQLDSTDFASLAQSAIADFFGATLNAKEREAVAAVHAHSREQNLAVSAFRDESGLLEDFLSGGLPPGNILVFTASTVDRRKRIFKKVKEAGEVVELTVERERSGALTAESAGALIDQVFGEQGKKIAPAARRLVLQRAGRDPGLLTIELEKLCLYAGERATIDEKDVEASFRDLAESWIFDFTRALAQRQAVSALTLLRSLFEQGDHPLRLLALIARELRMLLLAKDCLATLAGSWTRQTQFAVFRDRLFPRLSEEERQAFGGVHPFVVYLALQNASGVATAALQRALLRLQELDVKFKSSGSDPRLLLEAFVLDICGNQGRMHHPGG
jgi:DNA polymerase-3 subunit delta